jgi:hypothetical protein
MMRFLAKLFGLDSKFSALEILILDTVRNHLDSSLVTLWDRQLHAINKIQRLPGGIEVDFYRIKNRKPTFNEQLAFPNKSEELLIAKILININNSSAALAANIWCVKGFLFSIEYAGNPDYFEEAAAMEPLPEFAITCEMIGKLE